MLDARVNPLGVLSSRNVRFGNRAITPIIQSLPIARLSDEDEQKRDFAAFGEKYGNHSDPMEARSYLKGTLGLFCGIHSESLDRLKEFRDKIGAHSDSRIAIDSLPSPDEFENLFKFAKDFCELISRSITRDDPAPINRTVGHGFVRLIKSIGVQAAKFDFNEEN